jgi:hypothetical protein
MPRFLKRNPAKSPYGKRVVAVHERFLQDVDAEAARLGWDEGSAGVAVAVSAAAGAAVGLGVWGTYIQQPDVRERWRGFEDAASVSGRELPHIDIWSPLESDEAVALMFKVLSAAYVGMLVGEYWSDAFMRAWSAVADVMRLPTGDEPLNHQSSRVASAASHFSVLRVNTADLEQKRREAMLAQGLAKFDREIIAAMSSIATGVEIDADDFWPVLWVTDWTPISADALQTTVQRLSQLAPDGLPPAD